MPRSALLRPKTEILAVSNNLCLELKCSKRKNRAAAKINFATAPFWLVSEGIRIRPGFLIPSVCTAPHPPPYSGGTFPGGEGYKASRPYRYWDHHYDKMT